MPNLLSSQLKWVRPKASMVLQTIPLNIVVSLEQQVGRRKKQFVKDMKYVLKKELTLSSEEAFERKTQWLMSLGHWTSQKWHQALAFLSTWCTKSTRKILRNKKPKAQPNLQRDTSLTCSQNSPGDPGMCCPKSSPFSNQPQKPAPSDAAAERQSSPYL